MANNGRRPPLQAVPDTSAPVDIEVDSVLPPRDDPTPPDAPNAVTNIVLLKAIIRLELAVDGLGRGLRWLAASVAFVFAVVALAFGVAWYLLS